MKKIYKILENYWFLINQKIRFLLVGGFNTVVAYLLFLLMIAINVNYNIAIAVQFIFCVNLSIFTMDYYVFRCKNRIVDTYKKGVFSYIALLLFNYLVMFILVELLKISPAISQLIFIFINVPVTFLLHKHFTYKS